MSIQLPFTNSSADPNVRAEAYSLWEAEGRPDGRDRDHWFLAQAILQAAASQKLDSSVPGPSLRPASPVLRTANPSFMIGPVMMLAFVAMAAEAMRMWLEVTGLASAGAVRSHMRPW